MRVWSDSERYDSIAFACVCVDSRADEVSQLFQSRYFAGSRTFNAMIRDREDFPRFPTQLGCQGFVIVDAQGQFATLRSPSLNKVGKTAFEYVERVMEQLLLEKTEDTKVEEDEEEAERLKELKFSKWQRKALAEELREEAKEKDLAPAGPTKMESSAPAKEEVEAVFAEHACRDEPQPLDKPLDSFELPSVGHEGMDEEHAELEELMKRASTSLRKCDVEALRKMFAEHSTEEEDLMRRSNFGGGGGGGMFSAVDSHAADHASILEVASEVVASAGEDGLVSETGVSRLCRNIVEHAVNFDSRYKGQLIDQSPSSKRVKRDDPAVVASAAPCCKPCC